MEAQGIEAVYVSALREIGPDCTHADLLKRYPVAAKARNVSAIKPHECKFYEDFAADPAHANARVQQAIAAARKQHGEEYVDELLDSGSHHPLKKHRLVDFRLNEAEAERLASNGFVISRRLGADSFAEIYYQLYTDDMPVYVTADSVLHAWHCSFDALLIDFEEKHCVATIDLMLQATSELVKVMALKSSRCSLSRALLDVNLFLSMAQSLLSGELCVDVESNRAALTTLWVAVQEGQLIETRIFESQRLIDFSLFKPRGHYTKSKQLERYFQALMWLGTVDFRIAGGENAEDDLYQLQCALVLVHEMREARQIEPIASLDKLIASLVGDGGLGSDSMTPSQLSFITSAEQGNLLELYFPNGAVDNKRLKMLQQDIVSKGFGKQLINGHARIEDSHQQTTPTALPTSFSVFGQQFVWSAFVFTRLVYDQIVFKQDKVPRRIPSAVDVAFALFGNDAASEEIAQRMSAQESSDEKVFVKHRDGLPYTSNLVALRDTIDRSFAQNDVKEKSVSTLWVEALRELSKPAVNMASTFQSHEWQLRLMNTQIASYTQLRHDTVLYAKQSVTMGTRCEYADGFVDPYPVFWSRMRELANKTVDMVEGSVDKMTEDAARPSWQRNSAYFFREFAATMKTLEEITRLQSKNDPLTEDQVDFLKTVMEERFGSGGSRYLGWYPRLFYTRREDSGKRDVLAVDVHTDIPSIEHQDPGSVLHWGVGDVDLGYFSVNNVLYAGPVLSSYEFLRPINDRWTDQDFEANVKSVSSPQWALDSFLCT